MAWKYSGKVLPKNILRFQVKLSIDNSYFRVSIFYFDELQLPIKFSKEIS